MKHYCFVVSISIRLHSCDCSVIQLDNHFLKSFLQKHCCFSWIECVDVSLYVLLEDVCFESHLEARLDLVLFDEYTLNELVFFEAKRDLVSSIYQAHYHIEYDAYFDMHM